MRRVRRSTGRSIGIVGRCHRLLGEIGRGLLVWAAPNSLEIIVPHIPLLVNRSVKIGGVVGLGIQLPEGRGASLVLEIGRASWRERVSQLV